jgi:hypothetical protein
MMEQDANEEAEIRPSTGTTDISLDMREFGAMGTKRGSTHMASMSTIQTEGDVRHQGSFGRLSSIFRTDKTMSTVKGKSPVRSVYEASMVTEPRNSHEHIHDIDEDGLENVRACCGGISSLKRTTDFRQT